MRYTHIVGMLVATLVLTSTTTVHAQGIAAPDWVPSKVEGWTLAYNDTIAGLVSLGSTTTLVRNWSQIWFENQSSVLTSIVAVVSFEYTRDVFSSKLLPYLKQQFEAGFSQGGITLPPFTGETTWDLFKWLMGIFPQKGLGTTITDENIEGADGAFSLNVTSNPLNFYLLYAYRNKYGLMVFALDINQALYTNFTSGDMDAIQAWYGSWVDLLVSAFASVMAIFGSLPSFGAVPAVAEITSTGGIVPAADPTTSGEDVKGFASEYIPLLPAAGIPGYPLALVGMASLFAILAIVQKKRKAIVV